MTKRFSGTTTKLWLAAVSLSLAIGGGGGWYLKTETHILNVLKVLQQLSKKEPMRVVNLGAS